AVVFEPRADELDELIRVVHDEDARGRRSLQARRGGTEMRHPDAITEFALIERPRIFVAGGRCGGAAPRADDLHACKHRAKTTPRSITLFAVQRETPDADFATHVRSDIAGGRRGRHAGARYT